jgi:Cu/Ag efflux protein CusF
MTLLQKSIVVAALALASCSPSPQQSNAAPTAAAPQTVHARGVGEVVVLQPEYSAVTIRHGAIPEYGMGAMTMEFTTSDPAQLASLRVGDQVRFDLKGPTEIERIEVMKK